MSETATIIAELTRVKVLFQARTLAAAIGAPQPAGLATPTPIKRPPPMREEKACGLMSLDEARAFAERLADMDPNKMEFCGSRRWDAYRYVVPAVIAGLGLLKPEIDPDVLAVRAIMHAQQRAMTPPDSGWGDMSYAKGSYDDTPVFQAALSAYRSQKGARP